MTLNLNEITKALTHTNGVLSRLIMRGAGKKIDQPTIWELEDISVKLGQARDQLVLLRDMFYPTLPERED